MKCLILAGGSGDRLWPLSRRSYPKQFVEIKENRSFLQETILRNMPFCDEFLIVTNEKYKFIVKGQLQAFQGLKVRYYFEELSRGTAVPVALISMLQNPSELLMVTAADMAVGSSGYRESVLEAIELAKQEKVTVLGLSVESASARYGYIKYAQNDVLKFIEKPDYKEAKAYLEDGNYLWNSGMFITRSESFINLLEKCQPELYEDCKMSYKELKHYSNEVVIRESIYESLPKMSVEKAVFEKADELKVVKAKYSWKDMDTLEDVLPFTKRDEKNTITRNCENVNVLNRTSRQLVVVNDVSDVTVINTPDVVYVSAKGASGESAVELMNENEDKYSSYFEKGQIIYKPWGHSELLISENGFRVQKVTIFPNKIIEEHRHEHRSEHWSVVSGCAKICLDGEEKDYCTNDNIYIEKGTIHSIYNNGTQNLIIVEVGIGDDTVDNDTEIISRKDSKKRNIHAESIVKLEPAFKDYLWGGNKLNSIYNKKCDYDIIAESWELSAHPDGQSVIAEGRYKGMLFKDYLEKIGKEMLGWKADLYEDFPVLIKLIDARAALSIQVHPDDDFAMVNEGEYGKNEVWHIIDCEEDAYIYCGFKKKVTKEEILEAINEERLLELLNKYYVKASDTIFIPAGTVHAIGAGILLCEIQQNSNSTYRLYDYGRKDKYGRTRQLHLDKALQVIDTNEWSEENIRHESGEKIAGGTKELLVQCKYFETIKYNINDEVIIQLDDTSFCGIIVLKGKGVINTNDMSIEACCGDTFFLPIGQNEIKIKGDCQLLLTRV